jgi:hypothetical protein
VAEGGFGGNSATPERNQKADSPAVLLVQSRTPHKSFLFLLEEKNRRAQIKKCEENFFAGWRGFRATAGLASLLGVLLKKSSNINQKTPPRKDRLPAIFWKNFNKINYASWFLEKIKTADYGNCANVWRDRRSFPADVFEIWQAGFFLDRVCFSRRIIF